MELSSLDQDSSLLIGGIQPDALGVPVTGSWPGQ